MQDAVTKWPNNSNVSLHPFGHAKSTMDFFKRKTHVPKDAIKNITMQATDWKRVTQRTSIKNINILLQINNEKILRHSLKLWQEIWTNISQSKISEWWVSVYEKSSISLIIKEIQIQTTMKSDTPTEKVKIKKLIIVNLDKDMKQLEFPNFAGGCATC